MDPSNNIFIAGGIRSAPAYFDTIQLMTSGFGDIFLSKHNAAGDIIWAKRAGGNHATSGDVAGGICRNSNGSIFIAGDFTSFSSFDTVNVTGYGFSDAFLAKYNDSGFCEWARAMGGFSSDYASALCNADGNNVIVGGSYASALANFSPFF